MIPFNVPPFVGTEIKYIEKAVLGNKVICGDGQFTKKCSSWIEEKFKCKKALLTTSCTSALEMSAFLCDIKEGDEVIAPSYTFVSSVNAFAIRGAKIVFVDIRPDTMNINENLIEGAITNKTKAIIVVHYAGVSCEMDKIMEIAKRNNIYVIEDAAQGMMSYYNGCPLGTIGDFGCYSFHETKNYSMGEGGVILIKDEKYIERAEILREKGTDRSKFFRGQVDKYSWIDIGSSYLPSEINAAYLYAQLEVADKILENRVDSWNLYNTMLKDLNKRGILELPIIPNECTNNGHMFYIKVSNIKERDKLINYLKSRDILSVFHYIPLHSSKAGNVYGRFYGNDIYTTKESERLIRLPLYYNLDKNTIEYIVKEVEKFYS